MREQTPSKLQERWLRFLGKSRLTAKQRSSKRFGREGNPKHRFTSGGALIHRQFVSINCDASGEETVVKVWKLSMLTASGPVILSKRITHWTQMRRFLRFLRFTAVLMTCPSSATASFLATGTALAWFAGISRHSKWGQIEVSENHYRFTACRTAGRRHQFGREAKPVPSCQQGAKGRRFHRVPGEPGGRPRRRGRGKNSIEFLHVNRIRLDLGFGRAWLRPPRLPLDAELRGRHSYRSATIGSTFAARRAGI